MKVYEVPLTLVEHDSDIKIKASTKKSLSFVTRFCAYNLLIGPLVSILYMYVMCNLLYL